MSSAPIYRDSLTRVQSSVRRGTAGAQAGSRKVTGRTDRAVATPAGMLWVYDGDTRCSFGCSSVGTVLAGDDASSTVDSVSFTGTPDSYVDTSGYLTTGLFIHEVTIDLNGTAGDVVKVSILVGNNQDDTFVTMTGSTVECTFAVTGPAAVGEPFIAWAVTNLGANSITANPSGLGQLYPIILT